MVVPHLNFRQQLRTLTLARWGLALVALVLLLGLKLWATPVVATVLGLFAVMLLFAAVNQWVGSVRRRFIREAQLPAHLVGKICAEHSHLTAREADLVLRGLRQFFLAYQRSGHQFVAMPSRVVDTAWHAFILHTAAYQQWCQLAFGRLLHHTPAEVLGKDPKRNSGLRRAWFWACREESIDPHRPTRLPLLFALDAKFSIKDGYRYVPDCRDIQGKSNGDSYCGTDFSGGSSSDNGDTGFSFEGGGSEASGSDNSGCGSGCGGGGD